MEFTTHRRKPFIVEASQITEDNIEAAAELIGELIVDDEGVKSIKINKRLVPNMHRAYVGWWITEMGDNLRCYSPKIFGEQFEPDPRALV